jgi:ABC-type branched-subunit amino acid transport system substrate-binding protein
MVLVTGCGSTDSDTSTAAPTETSTTEEAQSGRAINVGLLAAETGPLAGAGGAFLSGALIGQQLVNETGLIGNGNTINLVIQEASEDPARSATVAAQIAADEQNVGLVCCILSPVAGAVSAVANRDGLPVILYGATQPGLAQPPYIFRTTTMPQFANETLGRELSEETGLKSVAYIVMTDNEGIVSQSESFKAGFASAGVEDLGTVEIVAKQTNFASAATSAIALGAEAISISATQAEAVGMVAALYDKNYDGQIIGLETLTGVGVFDSNPDALDKVPFPVYFLPSEVNEAGQRFVDAYNAEYGTLPDSFAAQGFNAIWVMGAALAGAGVEPTRASLGESLNALTEVPGTIYGTVKFENGQMLAVESVKIVSYSKPDGVIVPWIAP